jgi:hypothetical protein
MSTIWTVRLVQILPLNIKTSGFHSSTSSINSKANFVLTILSFEFIEEVGERNPLVFCI